MSRIGRFRLVVFDCDGTIVDSQHSIVSAMGRAFEDHGLPAPSARAVLNLVGLEVMEVVKGLAPGADAKRLSSLADAYKSDFFRQRQSGTLREPLYPGARDVIVGLADSGVLLGVATGKSQRGLRAVLDSHDLRGRFVTLQTADDAPGKPHPGMVLQAMAAAGVGAAETVMIGDTTYDMEMARAAGVAALGVAWGYHPPEDLTGAGAKAVAVEYPAIPSLLSRL